MTVDALSCFYGLFCTLYHELTSPQPLLTSIIRRFPSNPGTMVLDVGANDGDWAVHVATIGFDVRAFEALPANCNRINARLLRGSHHLRVECAPVWSVRGKSSHAGDEGPEPFVAEFMPVGGQPLSETSITLDDVVPSYNHLSYGGSMSMERSNLFFKGHRSFSAERVPPSSYGPWSTPARWGGTSMAMPRPWSRIF